MMLYTWAPLRLHYLWWCLIHLLIVSMIPIVICMRVRLNVKALLFLINDLNKEIQENKFIQKNKEYNKFIQEVQKGLQLYKSFHHIAIQDVMQT